MNKTISNSDKINLMIKIATLYLLKNKSISLSAIKALPFVHTELDIENIVRFLTEKFKIEVEIQKFDNNSSFLSFDTLYKLVNYS